MGKDLENYGDLLSPYIAEKISVKKVKWVQPKRSKFWQRKKENYLGIGSIIHHASKNSKVWGSGIIDQSQKISSAKFLAVRGPETRKYLNELGYSCPEVYGDPSLLLPEYYFPKIDKKFSLGIIPHYSEYDEIKSLYTDSEDISVIDLMTNDIEKTTEKILECDKVISTSLHGIIIPHAYGIPAIWAKYSDRIFGNDIKYMDYYASVGIFDNQPFDLKKSISTADLDLIFNDHFNQPNSARIELLKIGLKKSCPFIK